MGLLRYVRCIDVLFAVRVICVETSHFVCVCVCVCVCVRARACVRAFPCQTQTLAHD